VTHHYDDNILIKTDSFAVDTDTIHGMIISGRTFDKRTGLPVEAELEFINVATQNRFSIYSDPVTGKYETIIDTSGDYKLSVKATDYVAYEEKLSLDIFYGKQARSGDIYLDPIIVGHSITIENILFEKSTSILLISSYESLDQLALFLIQNPNIEIELIGYTSSEGEPHANQQLSENRAIAVKEYLIGKGVDSERMRTSGYGSSKPLFKNDTEEHRALNRRVEYKIIRK
jgi:outer membrane protein OmpA-like peptidoglycan-associated protein